MSGGESTQLDGAWHEFCDYARLCVVIYVGVFLHALNIFITSTTIPSITRQIGGGELINWVTTIYILMTVATSLVGPSLTRAAGVKKTLIPGALIFAFGSALCGVADTIYPFLAGRLFQGIGAGTLLVVAYSLIGGSLPERLRIKAFAMVGFVFSTAMLVGPSIGGLFAEFASWRFAFAFMAVASLIFLAVISISRAPLEEPKTGVADLGLFQLCLFVVGVICCISVVLLTNQIDDLLVGVSIATTALAALYFLIAIYRHERFGFLHPEILRLNGRVGLASWILFLLCVSMYSFSIYGAMLLQNIFSLSVTVAGYLVGGYALATTVGEVVIASVPKRHRGVLLICAQFLVLAGLCATGVFLREALLGWVLFSVAIAGLGCGLSLTGVSELIGQTTQNNKGRGASSSIPSIQMIGSAVGSALYGIIAGGFNFDENSSAELSREFALWVHVLPASVVFLAVYFALCVSTPGPQTR